MQIPSRLIAVLNVLLIFPATLFMTALVLRNLPPLAGPGHAPQQMVNLYAGHMWTLWILLLALPLAAFAIGCAALLSGLGGGREVALPSPTPTSLAVRNSLATIRSHPAALLVAATTVTSASILIIVILHMLAS